ncbi:MAG: rhomboid family intramembrane serine protease, partial [Gemmatimonadota bacterium]
GGGDAFVDSLCTYGTIPGELTGRLAPGATVALGPEHTCRTGGLTFSTVLTSMFMHGSWMHLIGNMWFLWVFGNNIEDSMGHVRYVVFYLLCGALASAAHVLTNPGSGVPTVGASGAISGIMGAYLVLYPKVRVHTLVYFGIFVRVIPMTALAVLGLWFGLQVLSGALASGTGAGVAFWAHVGGFVAGVALIKLFEKPLLTGAKRQGKVLSRDELGRFGSW